MNAPRKRLLFAAAALLLLLQGCFVLVDEPDRRHHDWRHRYSDSSLSEQSHVSSRDMDAKAPQVVVRDKQGAAREG